MGRSKNWRAIYKLIVQLIAGCIVAYAGFRFTRISFAPLVFSFPLAFCISDNGALDCRGYQCRKLNGRYRWPSRLFECFIANQLYRFIFKDLPPHFSMTYTCIILAATLIGFLFFNLSRPHAKVFMGDAGSQFLGFVLAVLPLVPNNAGSETVAIPFAIIL